VDEVLRRTHKLKETQESDFRVMSQSEILETLSSISDIMTYLLGAIAGISLLVGGIGIMNIMFVSVTRKNTRDWFKDVDRRKKQGYNEAIPCRINYSEYFGWDIGNCFRLSSLKAGRITHVERGNY